MTTRPWREIAIPNTDVIHGTFSEAEFAADLTKVRQGKAPPEYQDPATFFQRTYLTEGMRLLLHSVLQRLVGKGGDPIIQLKTAFGGGKTHSLLTVLHLAQGGDAAYQWPGIKAVLDGAGVASAPKARVVVLDGNALAPGQPIQRGTTTIHTLWGELAWQLGGSEGYAMVAEADRTGTSPGKEHLCALLERYAPVVVLMDESVAFLRQLVARNDLPAGTFAANLSFVQALTESMTATPRTVLLASLPESDSELAGPEGRLALEGLEKYFKRVESIWKPVAPQESFAIVRTRLSRQSATNPRDARYAKKHWSSTGITRSNSHPRPNEQTTRKDCCKPIRSIPRSSIACTRTGPPWSVSSARVECCSSWRWPSIICGNLETRMRSSCPEAWTFPTPISATRRSDIWMPVGSLWWIATSTECDPMRRQWMHARRVSGPHSQESVSHAPSFSVRLLAT
ncbi:MAG: ATP-binding protein [Fibrobacteres bacterium]|nr:ATP-binding protein [Fibrobacterota bacterium]